MFSVSDTIFGYWCVKIDRKDHELTAITSHRRLIQVIGLPFGAGNTLSTFQIAKDSILLSVNWNQRLVYLENTVIFSKNRYGSYVALERSSDTAKRQ